MMLSITDHADPAKNRKAKHVPLEGSSAQETVGFLHSLSFWQLPATGTPTVPNWWRVLTEFGQDKASAMYNAFTNWKGRWRTFINWQRKKNTVVLRLANHAAAEKPKGRFIT